MTMRMRTTMTIMTTKTKKTKKTKTTRTSYILTTSQKQLKNTKTTEKKNKNNRKANYKMYVSKVQIIATNIEPFLFEDHRMVNIAISGKLGFHFKTRVTSLRKRKFTYCRNP